MSKEIIKYLKNSIGEKGNYCYSLPVETTKAVIKEIERLKQENQELRDKVIELKEYEKAIYEIKKYIDAYSPYFLETQEENNQTIAIIINNIGN